MPILFIYLFKEEEKKKKKKETTHTERIKQCNFLFLTMDRIHLHTVACLSVSCKGLRIAAMKRG